MKTLPINSLEPLLGMAQADVAAAGDRVRASLHELVGSAGELAAAERSFQSVMYVVPDDCDDEEENRLADAAMTRCEDAKFELAGALERALDELALQERVLGDTRVTLEQVRDALQARSHELSPTMELGPKPGCVCS